MTTHERSAPAQRCQPRRKPITVSHRLSCKGPVRDGSTGDGEIEPFVLLYASLGNALANLVQDAEHGPSALSAASRGQDHECGNRGDSGLRDLSAIVVDRDVQVVALPCRKRNMAGWPLICPATLGNVNCLGRLVQPGGAAVYPLLHRLRNGNESIRWMSMHASASSSGRSLMGM